MTKQDRHILFMVVLTLALIVAAGVRVLFGAVAVAGDEVIKIGVAANLPKDVAKEIRSWSKGLSSGERAIFSGGLLALILKPVRSLDMASLISPLSQAGVLLARLWRAARAQVWGWIQSVKKSLAQLPSQLARSKVAAELALLPHGSKQALTLHKICVLRL